MNKLSTTQLKKILEDGVSVTLRGVDKVCNIETILCLVMNDNDGDLKNNGYEVSFDNVNSKRKCKNAGTLFKYLKKEKIVINDEADIISISDKWESYNEYIEYQKFSKINMEELLIRYKDADMFSLTGSYNDGYSEEYPHGIYGINDKIAANAIKKISEWSMKMLRVQYEQFTEEEKSKLPDFASLVHEIQKECDDYFALIKAGNIPKGQSPFLADLMHIGKTKYKEPQIIWHFYHELYSIHMNYKTAIVEMQKNAEFREPEYIFENPYYKELKKCLIDTEVTFTWHCTTTSHLSIVYYFKINEVSLNWLRQLKNDYDMKELDDLAFYKDGKIIFSSCTHEHFHTGD